MVPALLLFFVAAPAWAAQAAFPLAFVPNAGQVPEPVRFLIQTPELRAAFFPDGIVFQASGRRARVRFSAAAEPSGEGPLPGRVNFLTGNDPRNWRIKLPAYARLVYRDLYPGIDAVYTASGRGLKSEFRVAPGADPRAIRFAYEGSVRIEASGALVVRTAEGELREQAPVAFQKDGTPVPASFRLLEDGTVSFEIGVYDTSQALIIDPTIAYSTYLGGSGMGAVTGLAVDANGSLYAAGWTEALDFPIAGAFQGSNRGGVDAFVVKLTPAGDGFQYATYIGGAFDDRAAALAVDTSGQAYVAGATSSSNFPLAAPLRASMVGGKEAFALKLNAAGSALVYSTFLGGANWEAATAIAVDGSGAALVAGDTRSADFALLNPVQSWLGGATDAFLVKLNATGALQFATFLGGAGDEHAGGVAIGAAGDVYLAGGTLSTNFPLAAPLQASNAGGQDAFVARIRTLAPAQLVYSTYLGGSLGSAAAPEQANGIAVDSAGNMYVTGSTPSANFPVTGASLQPLFGGSRDVFVTKINAAGSARLFSTYLGSSGFDWGSGIGVDGDGNVLIAGYTSSVIFPNVDGVQAGFNGLYDAFLCKLNPSGDTLVFSSLYGGTGYDQASALALDASGNAFTGGQTSSLDFPLQAPIQSLNTGGSIGWLARFNVGAPPPQMPSADSASITFGAAGAATLTARYSHPAGAAALTEVAFLMGFSASTDYACYVKYSVAEQRFTLMNNIASTGGTTVAPGSGSAQNSQCTLNGAGSGAALSGTQLTLTASLVLPQGFPPSDTIYLYAASAAASTGWVARGTVPRVSADSASPAAGLGASQVFTFAFSDSQDAANVTTMAILIHSSLTFTNACYLVFERSTNTIKLIWDGATGATPKPLGSAAILQNSQCAVGVVTLTVSGTTNLLTVPLAYKASFNGAKRIYMLAAGPANNTGWVERGTYTVLAPGNPVAESVSPASGEGFGGLFTFTVSDAAGSSAITGMAMLFAPTLNANNACYLIYDRATGRVSLAYDNLSGSSPVALGSATSVANTMCQLSGVNSSVSIGATAVSLTVNVTFLAPFAGPKNIYLFASETIVNSGWINVGAWIVPDTPPTLGSVTPSSGSGTTPSFTASATTVVTPSNLTKMHLLMTAAWFQDACWVVYDRIAGTVGLYSDDAATLASKPVGSSAALQNSQCAVGYSAATASGNTVTWTVNLLLKAAFSGSKTVYLSADTPTTSAPFAERGSWTVP
jgi:hypothetical protein